eukprot:scaffold331319_cov23-Prasinocladus_malaysianus.AAC.1
MMRLARALVDPVIFRDQVVDALVLLGHRDLVQHLLPECQRRCTQSMWPEISSCMETMNTRAYRLECYGKECFFFGAVYWDAVRCAVIQRPNSWAATQ